MIKCSNLVDDYFLIDLMTRKLMTVNDLHHLWKYQSSMFDPLTQLCVNENSFIGNLWIHLKYISPFVIITIYLIIETIQIIYWWRVNNHFHILLCNIYKLLQLTLLERWMSVWITIDISLLYLFFAYISNC